MNRAVLASMDRLAADKISLPGVDVRVVQRCGSTNAVLMAEGNVKRPVLLATEHQTAGRGRRGRRWHSAAGGAITFSLARGIVRPVRELAALSLVAGVAAASVLRALGVTQAALKWPNDLVVKWPNDLAVGRPNELPAGEAKLGGILVETRSQGKAALAVIGIGINHRLDPGLQRRLRRRVACLEGCLSPLPDRNSIIKKIAAALLEALEVFERGGLDALRSQWLALHAHDGRRLRVRLADGRTLTGIAAGLAEDGGLQLRTRAGIRAVRSGRVISARAA